jgi:lysophospholipase L1-like esterase
MAAIQMNWICNLDAQPGTGYLNDGSANNAAFRPFAQRLEEDARKYRADVIVVDGGRNDTPAGASATAAAAAEYLAAVRRQWPRAVLVVIAPFFVTLAAVDYPVGVELGQRLHDIVPPLGGVVIDPMASGWAPPPEPATMVSTDGVHPNPAGHRYLADHLSQALREVGLGDVPLTDRGLDPTSPPGG